MKVPIPLDSSLCTDSHKNEIKDPTVSRDLFAVNRSYFYNGHLTNARKREIPPGDYIATKGDLISTVPGSDKTRIVHNGRVIANVNSIGIEDVSYLDKDDAVIDEGSLWTVHKTLTGYILEQTDLQTGEVSTTTVEQEGVLEVRLVRNTHKVITLNVGGSVTIDGVNYQGDANMRGYLSSFNGDFIAVEINGKITFGYNNPSGITPDAPTNSVNININANTTGWRLVDEFNSRGLDQSLSYNITVTVANGVQIGASGSREFAMDFVTGIQNPQNHNITLILGNNVIISGRGGNGGGGDAGNGGNGTTAINIGSSFTLVGNPSAKIQGGGGGGAGFRAHYSAGVGSNQYFYMGGGGGAGIPAGIGGAGTTVSGTSGSVNSGGGGAKNARGNGGDGGSPGSPGKLGTLGNVNDGVSGAIGQGGNAIRRVGSVSITRDTVNGPVLVGNIV